MKGPSVQRPGSKPDPAFATLLLETILVAPTANGSRDAVFVQAFSARNPFPAK